MSAVRAVIEHEICRQWNQPEAPAELTSNPTNSSISVMETTRNTPVSYELVFDPSVGATLVRRTIHLSARAGVIAPLAATVPAQSRLVAEQEAFRFGLLRCGPWATSRGCDYAPARSIN